MRVLHLQRNHVILALGLLALAGVGCGGGHGTYANLQWNVYDVGDANMAQPLGCDTVGAGDVEVTMVNPATNQTFTDVFHCASRGGSTATLPTGTYDTTVSLYGDPAIFGNKTTLLDQISSTQNLYSGANNLPVVDLLVNAYVLGWSIWSGTQPSTCTAVGAASVALDIYYGNPTDPVSYTFNCNSNGYRAATTAIAAGNYGIQWQAFLLDAAGNEITSGSGLTPYSVMNSVDPTQAQSRTQADLGTVSFQF